MRLDGASCRMKIQCWACNEFALWALGTIISMLCMMEMVQQVALIIELNDDTVCTDGFTIACVMRCAFLRQLVYFLLSFSGKKRFSIPDLCRTANALRYDDAKGNWC